MKKIIVLFAVLAMVVAFTVPAMADVSLYGSSRFMTYSKNVDKEVVAPMAGVPMGSLGTNPYGNAVTGYDDRDTVWGIDNLTRWGAKFTGGDVGGLWEMDARLNGKDTSSTGDLRIRHLYGYWNFGAGQLLIGQTWPLTDLLQSNLQYTDSGMQWFGGMGMLNARISQLRLTFGNFAVAFLTPNIPAAALRAVYTTDTDVTIPKIELKYTLPMEPVTLNFVGGYQTYDEVSATDQDVSIDSWVVAAQAKANFGAFYANLVLHYSQNEGNYGLGGNSVVAYAYGSATSATDAEDMTTWGATLTVGFKVSDMTTIEAGYGKLKTDADDFGAVGTDFEDEAQAYYLNATFTMAPGVYIIPEFAIFDYEDISVGSTTTDQGKITVFGVFWKIDFK